MTAVLATGTYLNFKVNWNVIISSSIKAILSNPTGFGRNEKLKGKTIIVEFSSPNIAKPFHAGHLRSTIIGNFLKNLFKFCGAHVVGMNYLGDWGKQYGLLAVGYAKYGDEKLLKEDPIQHLYKVYVKINGDAGES